ncbi:7369_t:CDS:2, partial [Cetraspora pellucida]
LFKKRFASKIDEMVDTYLDLISREVKSKENETKEWPLMVEYLLLVATDGLLYKVRAAIYLLLDELWTVPMNITLVAMFLDPRFKHFNWMTNDNKKNLVDSNYNNDNNDFFYELESNSIQVDVKDNDEVMHYVKLKEIKLINDHLE